VIIPAFNAQEFLEGCVRSVWDQSLSSEQIEIIVADDGSSDGTRELAERLALISPIPMKITSHHGGRNRGVSATRNLACSRAQGEFIALLDADDLFLPDRLAASTSELKRCPSISAVCSLGWNVDRHGERVTGYNGSEVAGDWKGVGDDLDPPFTFEQLWRTDPIANSSITIRRDAFEAVGGYPEVMAHQAEDWLLVLKLSLLAPIPCIDRELFCYRHHEDAYTHLYHAANFRDGARLEVFYHLTHWMLSRAETRSLGSDFFRKEYPRTLAAHHRLFPIIRDYASRRGIGAETLEDFEDYLLRQAAELGTLRRVVSSQLREARQWRLEALSLRRERNESKE
jgi:glycosyltransferase involved in cell wall biosynthesis